LLQNKKGGKIAAQYIEEISGRKMQKLPELEESPALLLQMNGGKGFDDLR